MNAARPKPHLTLVQKRAANAALTSEDEDDEARFLADLRGLIWEKGGAQGGSWKDLAARAKLADRTIARFASGETKKPQLFTIRRMIQAIGYVIVIQPRGRKRP